MNNKITINKTDYQAILEMRKEYLTSLPKFQDLYLEIVVKVSDYFQLLSDSQTIGYAVVNEGNTLVEFYICNKYLKKSCLHKESYLHKESCLHEESNFSYQTKVNERCNDLFLTILSECKIEQILCKSFDMQMMNCCNKNRLPYTVQGILYREFSAPLSSPGKIFHIADKSHSTDNSHLTDTTHLTDITNLTDNFAADNFSDSANTVMRYAQLSDLPFLTSQDDEVFEPKEHLEVNVNHNEIIICEYSSLCEQKKLSDVKSPIIGCGFLTRIADGFDYFDLGVWVSPDHRRKGYAIRIMQYMRSLCLNNGWVPICGCSAENHASQKMLSKIGYVCNHKLLEFRNVILD